MLRKRAVIEPVNVELKNICQIEHTGHRCSTNLITHLIADPSSVCTLWLFISEADKGRRATIRRFTLHLICRFPAREA
jgi:hypothetical protein